jgi:hypothetical protein
MAKRVRGSSRPGQRRPVSRRPGSAPARPSSSASSAASSFPERPSVAPRPGGLTDAEVQRAAEIEAAMLAEERAAEVARRRSQERATAARETAGARSIRPEEEYAYVARDVRDIVRIAALLLVILFGLWIAIDVAGVVKIT